MDFGEHTYVRPGSAAEGGPCAGQWRLERELGRGGMGSVWAARHVLLGSRAAVKVMHAEYARMPDQVQRFIEEAKAGALLRHPNLVQVFDCFVLADGRPCFVMELLEGATLEELAGTAPMDPERARGLLVQLAGALAEVHYRGLVHRDVKAQNALVVRGREGEEVVKLLDLGIAKNAQADLGLTAPGTAMGTPHYMAPEQALGAPVDFRTDVYALGVLGYRLLRGRLPFEGSVQEVMLQHLQAEPPPLTAGSEALRGVIARAMRKKPVERYETAGELARALRAATMVEAKPAPAPVETRAAETKPAPAATEPGGRRARAERFRRRFPVVFGASGHAGFTLNLSATGLALTTQHPQALGTRVALRFAHVEQGPRVHATVVWSRAPALRGGNGVMGLRIDGADEAFFKLLVEVANTKEGAEPRVPKPAPKAGPAPQVMVVEDNRDIRQLLTDAFLAEGYEVLPCADGGLAMAAMERLRRPSAVVLDLMMPLTNGWKFLDALRASPEHRDVPVVVVSAHPEAGKLPGTHFVPKPFELDAVTSLVGRLVAV